MLFRSPLRDLENNISSQSKPQHLLRISITLFVGPSVSLAKAAAPGKRSAPTLLRTFKPDGRTVGLGGTIVRVAGCFHGLASKLLPATWQLPRHLGQVQSLRLLKLPLVASSRRKNLSLNSRRGGTVDAAPTIALVHHAPSTKV